MKAADAQFLKVFSAWGANTGAFAALSGWLQSIDSALKLILVFGQIGVAFATVVYILYKIRELRRGR